MSPPECIKLESFTFSLQLIPFLFSLFSCCIVRFSSPLSDKAVYLADFSMWIPFYTDSTFSGPTEYKSLLGQSQSQKSLRKCGISSFCPTKINYSFLPLPQIKLTCLFETQNWWDWAVGFIRLANGTKFLLILYAVPQWDNMVLTPLWLH